MENNLTNRHDPLAIWSRDLKARLESFISTAQEEFETLPNNDIGVIRSAELSSKINAFRYVINHINSTV